MEDGLEIDIVDGLIIYFRQNYGERGGEVDFVGDDAVEPVAPEVCVQN